MRFSSAIATIVALFLTMLSPAAVLAQSSGWSSGESATTTVTLTLIAANATSYVHYTSSMPSSLNTATVSTSKTATYYSSPSLSAQASATPSICTNCIESGSDTQRCDLVIIGLTGAAALFWSLL